MRRLLKWVVVTIGIAALVRWLRRRGRTEEAPSSGEAGDPADELRRKLAETRTEEAAAPPAPDATVEERRTEVHEEGRSAIDEMRGASSEDS